MTNNKKSLDLLDKEIEKAEEMRLYYRDLLTRYEGKIEALKDLRNEFLVQEEEEEEEEKKGE